MLIQIEVEIIHYIQRKLYIKKLKTLNEIK